MVGRIACRLIPGVGILWVVGAALGQGCRPLRAKKQRSGIAQPIPSYGSTPQARTITLGAILGTVARSAVLTFAKLKPTKMACTHGQIHDEGKKILALRT